VPPTDRDEDPEDPFEEWRRRIEDDPFLAPFFEDLDREFDRMRESLSRMLREMEEGDRDPTDLFVYGFSVQMGAQGPEFEEFGNVDAAGDAGEDVGLDEAREPLVDVQEAADRIAVTAELPGVDRDDITLRAKGAELVVEVDTEGREFFKRIDLPAPVEPATTEATYKNGVLDVEIDKADGEPGTEVPPG
jgi:HSP20 family protein